MVENTQSGPKLEYNLAGGLLLTVREGDLEIFTNELAASGYHYGCILPFRGLESEKAKASLVGSSLSVVHLEEVWNPTPHENILMASKVALLEEYQRLSGRPFKFRAWDALFPGEVTCNKLFHDLLEFFPGSKFISHKMKLEFNFPDDRLLVEINPGIEQSSQQILEEAEERKVGLVFDPSHLLASSKVISVPQEPTKKYRGEWERQFDAFSRQIEVVDINPQKPGDVEDLLRGTGLLRGLAQRAQETNGIKFLRVEIRIPSKWQIPGSPFNKAGFEFLQAIGERLMEG